MTSGEGEREPTSARERGAGRRAGEGEGEGEGDPSLGIAQVACWTLAANGALLAGQDEVAIEAPFELKLGDEALAITMRTPGHDQELTAGFLCAEGHIAGQVSTGRVVRRGTLSTAACGVCGRDGIEDLVERLSPLATEARFDASMLSGITARLRARQPNFSRTGGLHAAALVSATGELLCVREDVGRHNAVDKVIGRAVLDGALPLGQHLLVVSGRTSFEIVQKAVAAGIPAIVAVSAPSSLAIELSERFRVLLVGFARAGSFKVYAGAERVLGAEPAEPGASLG